MSKITSMMAAAKQRGDFETVCKHYGCSDEEISEMREIAKHDRQSAIECFVLSGRPNSQKGRSMKFDDKARFLGIAAQRQNRSRSAQSLSTLYGVSATQAEQYQSTNWSMH